VLEDDPAVLALVELGLEGRGASVAPVTNEHELRRALEHGVFDALLLDLSPLEANPREALAEMRALSPGVPVVIISGSASPDVDSTGVAAWVRKPFEVKELVQALTRIRAES
jgi:CheY-like chemotaxis protein